jgi:4-hydroxy-2-oxoheptanedioate aldolase
MNDLKHTLSAGRPTFGAIATIPSVASVQVLANAGLDWLLIDMEHSPIDIKTAHAMIAATAGTATAPLVRIPSADPSLAKPLLDLGALGVCFPMICSGNEAEKAVGAVRYPPNGHRQWGPFYAPLRWQRSIPEYMATANEDLLAIITIEHPAAVTHIDDIMSTPGVDLAFVGPGDLATALGVPGQFDHPAFTSALAAAEAGIRRHQVPLGGAARSPDHGRGLLDRGYTAIALGFDWLLLRQATVDLLRQLRG